MREGKLSPKPVHERPTVMGTTPAGDLRDRFVTVRVLPDERKAIVASVTVSKWDQARQSVKVRIEGVVSERNSNPAPKREVGAS